MIPNLQKTIEDLLTEGTAEGLLLVDKPVGKTSFALVGVLRRILGVRKIGHAGTLDPFATGVMVMLIAKNYTRKSDSLLTQEKEYIAELHLGIETDSYDLDGKVLQTNPHQPTLAEIEHALKAFQGTVLQIPPMFSAKKIGGKKLYELARKGKEIERAPVAVTLQTSLVEYGYPYLKIDVTCSKGTYIRSIASDLGKMLGCGAHLSALRRSRSGQFTIQECMDGSQLFDPNCQTDRVLERLIKL